MLISEIEVGINTPSQKVALDYIESQNQPNFFALM